VGAFRTTSAVGLVVALLAGCGDSGDSKSATRPAELFKTPPAGLAYKVPDGATLQQVKDALSKDAPNLKGDDVAVRQLVKQGGTGQPVAVGVVIDAHNTGQADDAIKGFNDGLKQKTGKGGAEIDVAGTKASLGEVQGLTVALTAKNGYVVESLAGDANTVKTVLARLIFAAGQAKR
jgi:hypothetical protein